MGSEKTAPIQRRGGPRAVDASGHVQAALFRFRLPRGVRGDGREGADSGVGTCVDPPAPRIMTPLNESGSTYKDSAPTQGDPL